ncbi:MAG TPA: glycine dehydrogenase (aminomethyl-transferring), partial [Microscillaceae bacterium]|nr:glycine dehydrogenase (aminomethyl-transferring) [Microscillaceae bacterium]
MNINLKYSEKFEQRHNSSATEEQVAAMLNTIGETSVDALIDKTIPASIRKQKALDLPNALTEHQFLKEFKQLADKNQLFTSYIGQGYYDCIVPNVILRNVLENPGWYTAYTPYQAEIAQGRLEALINFQTTVMDLTGMEIANASLLDEGTAAAEAMTMFYGTRKKDKKKANTFFVSELCHPQTIEVIETRATPLGINLLIGDHTKVDLTNPDIYGVLLQYPASNGEVYDYTDFIATAKELNISVAVAADLLSLTLLTPPGEMGADV